MKNIENNKNKIKKKNKTENFFWLVIGSYLIDILALLVLIRLSMDLEVDVNNLEPRLVKNPCPPISI